MPITWSPQRARVVLDDARASFARSTGGASVIFGPPHADGIERTDTITASPAAFRAALASVGWTRRAIRIAVTTVRYGATVAHAADVVWWCARWLDGALSVLSAPVAMTCALLIGAAFLCGWLPAWSLVATSIFYIVTRIAAHTIARVQ